MHGSDWTDTVLEAKAALVTELKVRVIEQALLRAVSFPSKIS
jgi:hypothetical protein